MENDIHPLEVLLLGLFTHKRNLVLRKPLGYADFIGHETRLYFTLFQELKSQAVKQLLNATLMSASVAKGQVRIKEIIELVKSGSVTQADELSTLLKEAKDLELKFGIRN